MGLDQSGVLTVGTLVCKEGVHTLLHNTLLVIPPWSRKPPLSVGSPRSLHQGSSPAPHGQQGTHSLGGCKPDKWPSGSPGNHKHWTAGHSQGTSSNPQAADV